LSNGLFYDKLKISFICNYCNYSYNESCNKIMCRRTHCTKCNSKVKNTKFVKTKYVLKNTLITYYLYLVKFTTLNQETIFKVGLTR
jgi:hypothetical protein